MVIDENINDNQDKVVNEDSKTYQIFIIGEVNAEMSKEIIRTLFEIDWKQDNVTNLNVYISSEGGFLSDCFAMIDAFQFIKDTFNVHISTFGLGECASAGFFLFLLGDTRILFPNCVVFVHEHLTVSSESTYSDIKRENKHSKTLYEMYVKYTSIRLGLSTTKIKNLLKRNRYLTCAELSKFNIITHKCNEIELDV